MEIVFHLGAHYCESGLLLRSLLKQGDLLSKWNVGVPGPSNYRRTIGELVGRHRGNVPDALERGALVDAINANPPIERVILSNESFICVPDKILENGEFYRRAFKTQWLRQVFPNDTVIFALSICNPAGFLSDHWDRQRNAGYAYSEFLGGLDPFAIRWSMVIEHIRSLNPNCPIFVWCREDIPFVWEEVLQVLTGIPETETIESGYDTLSRVMRRRGVLEFRDAMKKNPDFSTGQKRILIGELAEKWALDSGLESEISLPGWDQDMVGRATDIYEYDVLEIAKMEGVVVVTP